MKIKKGFVVRTICGEHIVSGEGLEQIDFNKLINLNDTALYLWNAVEGKDFSIEDLVKLLTGEYEVDEATAKADAEQLCKEWEKEGLIDL